MGLPPKPMPGASSGRKCSGIRLGPEAARTTLPACSAASHRESGEAWGPPLGSPFVHLQLQQLPSQTSQHTAIRRLREWHVATAQPQAPTCTLSMQTEPAHTGSHLHAQRHMSIPWLDKHTCRLIPASLPGHWPSRPTTLGLKNSRPDGQTVILTRKG